eukprot:4518875-Prorocentrum_lima.AAC.1
MTRWVAEATPNGAGRLHKWVKKSMHDPTILFEYQLVSGVAAQPLDMMDLRVATWSRLWCRGQHKQQLQIDSLHALCTLAKDSTLEELSENRLLKACKKIKGSTARGFDHVGGNDLKYLPPVGVNALLELLRFIELD